MKIGCWVASASRTMALRPGRQPSGAPRTVAFQSWPWMRCAISLWPYRKLTSMARDIGRSMGRIESADSPGVEPAQVQSGGAIFPLWLFVNAAVERSRTETARRSKPLKLKLNRRAQNVVPLCPWNQGKSKSARPSRSRCRNERMPRAPPGCKLGVAARHRGGQHPKRRRCVLPAAGSLLPCGRSPACRTTCPAAPMSAKP